MLAIWIQEHDRRSESPRRARGIATRDAEAAGVGGRRGEKKKRCDGAWA